MKVSRRDLLLCGAGTAAGLLLTPLPWKVLDDTAIWSQNWSWISQPARGPIEVKQSFCTLCPRGCAIRLKMAGGCPVGVSGVKNNPITRGALCPLAFGAHQLNAHPRRLRTVRHHGNTSSWQEARAAFTNAGSEGPITVVDGFPNRAASSVFEQFADKQRGRYRTVLSAEAKALSPYEKWTGASSSALGYDLENTATALSFGSPLLDGWGPPGRFTHLWCDRAADINDPQLRLIQVDESLTRTAAGAWRWIPIREGSEGSLAAGLAIALLEQRLLPAAGPMPSLTLTGAAAQTGLSTTAIRDLARVLVEKVPAVAIAKDGNPQIAALNVVLRAVGTRGGIVTRSKRTKADMPADSDIRSVRAVLIDSTVPWDFSPQNGAEVFRWAAWDGGSSKADWLLPAPAFLEDLTDVPTAPTLATETYAIAPDLLTLPAGAQSLAAFLRSVEPALPTVEQVIRQRCEDLFRGRAGTVHGHATSITNFASSQKIEEELRQGSVWIGDRLHDAGLRCELKEWPGSVLSEAAESLPTLWPGPVLPPLASKVYEESRLRGSWEGRQA